MTFGAIGEIGSSVQADAELCFQAGVTFRRNANRATVPHPVDPAKIEAMCRDPGTHCAAQMRPPFTPIEARFAEDPASLMQSDEIHPPGIEHGRTAFRQHTGIVIQQDVLPGDHGIGNGDAEPPRQMVEAGARPA